MTETLVEGNPTVAKWISDINLAEKKLQPWRDRCKKIMARYKQQATTSVTTRKFAMLWSNVQTLAPAVYARTPTAVVGRRFKDADPVGRVASEVIERALNFTLDVTDFQGVMTSLRNEYLLFARGQAWVRYVPHISTKPGAPQSTGEATTGDVQSDPEPEEIVDWEEARPDYIAWEDFGHNPARNWGEVRLVWKRACMTRAELIDRFGEEIGKAIPLDWKVEGGSEDSKDDENNKAAIYEVWDIASKSVKWISKGYPAAFLDDRPDPLGLRDFFPCPKPAYGTLCPDSLIPTPDYIYYQDQAEEIDDLTQRIDKLTEGLKMAGWFAGEAKDDLGRVLAPENENKLIPVESWAAMQGGGGMRGMIEFWPAEKVAETIKACVELRKQLIEDVWQITGVADVMRGTSDPDETLGAQKLKGNWGSMRVRDRKKELERFARDLLRIMAEVIASKFSQETLAAMTDVQIPTAAEKQQAFQQFQLAARAAQAPPQPGAPPAPMPQPPPILSEPTWEDVMALLQNNALRAFRIDVETDSTIEPNEQEEKQARVEFIGAVGKFLAESLPVVQAQPAMLPLVIESLKFLVRGFRVGREMEDVIDRAMDALQSGAGQPPAQAAQGPNPQAEMAKAQAANTNAQANVLKAQAAQGNVQVQAAKVQSAHAIGMAQVQAENQRTAADVHMGAADNMHDAIQQAEQRAVEKTLQKEIMPGPLIPK